MKVEMKKSTAISIMAVLSVLIFFVPAAEAVDVVIPDPALETAIRDELGIPSGPITDTDLAVLTSLDAYNKGITDLTGLEYCLNLVDLELRSNNISDISPLSGLTNLEDLTLGSNNISDISPLSGLTNLEHLHLHDNNVSDISPLSGLTNLGILYLDGNNISDISALSGLTNMVYLYLNENNISDISPLSGLTNLSYLILGSNNISDISPLSGLTNMGTLHLSMNNISDIQPLVDNTGLDSADPADRIWLEENPLSYAAIKRDIPILEARGVLVSFSPSLDDRIPTTLLKVFGNGQTGLTLSALPFPFVVLVLDQNGDPFEGVPVTFSVTAGGGSLDVENTTTDADGLAQAILTLGPSPGTNTVKVTAAEVATPVTFGAIAESRDPIADAGPDQDALVGETLWFYGVDSYDPDGIIVSYEWDFDDGSPPEWDILVSHAYDTLGTYNVTLTVEDGDGDKGTDTAIITILTPAEFTEDMIAAINSWDLPRQTKSSLIDSLRAAVAPLEKDDERAAIRKLRSFIGQCETQRGKKLTAEQADYLIEGADRLIAAIKH